MVRFDDLKFFEHPNILGIRAVIFFENGYGASVVQGQFAYTSNNQEYELAVLKGNEKHFNICYTTPLTDDVIGHCSKDEITKYLNEIENLKEER